MKMKFNGVISAFNQYIKIDTYGCGYNDTGVFEETYLGTKYLKGIVLLLSQEQLQLLQTGETSDSGISVIVREPLNFNDNRYPNKNAIAKQDYIEYGGYKYRVIGTGILEFNTNCYTYTAVRYIK